MVHTRIKKLVFVLAVMVVVLGAGCAVGQPRLIAAYPSGGEGQTYAQPPDSLVYEAYLEIEVYDPAAAAEKAQELAEAYDGYLISSQTTRWETKEQVTVVLVVPARRFESLRQALGQLGTLKRERLSAGWTDDRWDVFSEVTLSFQPGELSLPGILNGWNPGRTFRQAFNVFITLFGFLADIVIWALVVVGPFALLVWVSWKLLRRWKRKTKPDQG